MKRFIVFDGNAILHRAYHAIPPLTTKDGRQVNAVYGFVSMLLRVIQDLKPTHVAVTFDRPAATFRKELFKEYQSHRPKMEDGLSSQIAIVHEVVAAMGIPIFEKDGFEADDVIGTIAHKVVQEEVKIQNSKVKNATQNSKVDETTEVVIVTGDRDILQLVNDHVKVFMPVKGLSEGKLFGEQEVGERMGVGPKEIIEYKALVGDSSDNYPGVAGIGPKTAITLIEKFHTVENLYNNLNQVSNKTILAKLEANKENAMLSHTLATIVTDVPVDIDLEQCILKDFQTPEVYALFDELQFRSLAVRLSLKEGENSERLTEKKNKREDQKQDKNNQEQIKLF